MYYFTLKFFKIFKCYIFILRLSVNMCCKKMFNIFLGHAAQKSSNSICPFMFMSMLYTRHSFIWSNLLPAAVEHTVEETRGTVTTENLVQSS